MDLTKITTPFGLLDEETQEALRTHGGPYERWDGFNWTQAGFQGDQWRATAWRVKPQPPKPREWWVTGGNCLWNTREEAEYADNFAGTVIHVREVLE